MNRGTWRRRHGLLTVVVLLVTAGLITVMVGGCGGSDTGADDPTTTEASSSPSSVSQTAAEGEGVLLAKDILAAFDTLGGEVAGLAQGKPDPAVLKPQLEELYGSYVPVMEELNVKYLALKDADTIQFGQCNGYISDNRPQAITAMQDAMVEAIRYYNLELGDQDIVKLLTERPVELLDMAVDQGQ